MAPMRRFANIDEAVIHEYCRKTGRDSADLTWMDFRAMDLYLQGLRFKHREVRAEAAVLEYLAQRRLCFEDLSPLQMLAICAVADANYQETDAPTYGSYRRS